MAPEDVEPSSLQKSVAKIVLGPHSERARNMPVSCLCRSPIAGHQRNRNDPAIIKLNKVVCPKP